MIVSLVVLGTLLLLTAAALAVYLAATLYGRLRQFGRANRDLAGRVQQLARNLAMAENAKRQLVEDVLGHNRRLLALSREIQSDVAERGWSNQRRTISAILDMIAQGRRSGLPDDQLLELLAASLTEREGVCTRHGLLLSLRRDPRFTLISPPSDRTA